MENMEITQSCTKPSKCTLRNHGVSLRMLCMPWNIITISLVHFKSWLNYLLKIRRLHRKLKTTHPSAYTLALVFVAVHSEISVIAVPTNQQFMVTSHGSVDVLNNRLLDCLFNILFSLTSKKISMLRITGPLWGESSDHRWIPCSNG